MNKWVIRLVLPAVIVLLVICWMLYFHGDFLVEKTPAPLQRMVKFIAKTTPPEVPEDEDPDNAKNVIPVHTAHVTTATLHRYIEGFGTITAQPARKDQMAGSANIVSIVAGMVGKVTCEVGQQVHAGDTLIQLDDRLAKAAEDQAVASLAQAEASLAALKALPRPDQLQVAQLGVAKAASALQFAQKNYDRQKELAAEQVAPSKSVEQAAQDLAGAQNDVAVAERQLAILKNTPTLEDLNQENAKVAQSRAALAAAHTQRQLMTITAPIDATVAAVSVNAGESVDTTRTLVQLIALDRLMVDLDVPADQLPAAAEGLAAEIVPSLVKPTDESTPMMGKVAFVSPQVDPRNGTVMVGIDLPADAHLRPGLTIRARIIAEEHKDVLAVPRPAVVENENGDTVIALVEGEQATHKTVKAGLEEKGLMEITADGVKEGDTVVTEGAFGLRETQATHVKVLD